MKNVISKIPSSIVLLYHDGNFTYSTYGVASSSSRMFAEGERIRDNDKMYFAEIVENTFVIKCVEIISGENDIIFDSIEVARYSYDPNYRELNIVFENFGEYRNNVELDRKRKQILEGLLNKEMLSIYMSSLIRSDVYYEEMVNNKILYFNAINFFTLYLSKVNKAFELLLENEMYHEIEYLLNNGVSYDEFGYEINAKTIRLAKNLTMVDTSGIIMSAKLLQKFNLNEIENLMKVAAYFNFSSESFWNMLLEMDVNLTEFSNYLIKSIFINNNMEYNDGHSKSARMRLAVENFTQLLRDYLTMKEVEDPIYPDNLLEAHNLAIDSYEKRRKETIERERMEAFAKNVKEYQYLADEIDGFKFVIPETPDDLTKEGRKMSHCVGGYVSNVISGISKIVFVRKEDEPYITIECRNNTVVQAKKFRNELPDEDDKKLISEWASKKNLVVRSY